MLVAEKSAMVRDIVFKAKEDIQKVLGKPVNLLIELNNSTDERTQLLREVITDVTGILWSQMAGLSRKREIVMARHLYCFFARKFLRHGVEQIGHDINRHHTSACVASSNILSQLKNDDLVRHYYTTIQRHLNETKADA